MVLVGIDGDGLEPGFVWDGAIPESVDCVSGSKVWLLWHSHSCFRKLIADTMPYCV